MTYIIKALNPGKSSVLIKENFTPVSPKENEVLIKNESIGINFIDIYIRKGIYPWPVEKDLVLGCEGAGIVESIGENVKKFKEGDRVAYVKTNGAYSTHRTIEESLVVHLPEYISFDLAAAIMLKGLTVKYLFNDSFQIKGHENVLFHASAGGVGIIAGQWLNSLGINAIGTAGSKEKCMIAMINGYSNVINYKEHDFQPLAMELTGGEGFDVVYDSVGQDTMARSFGCLKKHGTVISFGQSSGVYKDLKMGDIQAGSFFLSRPTLFHFLPITGWLDKACEILFSKIRKKEITIECKHSYSLQDVGKAHDDIENRKTTGSVILKA